MHSPRAYLANVHNSCEYLCTLAASTLEPDKLAFNSPWRGWRFNRIFLPFSRIHCFSQRGKQEESGNNTLPT